MSSSIDTELAPHASQHSDDIGVARMRDRLGLQARVSVGRACFSTT